MPFNAATIPVEPFTISHSTQEIDDLKTLLRLSPLSVDTYENQTERGNKFGPSKAWMEEMKSSWQSFDWESAQSKLNEYPQFIAHVPDIDPKTGQKDTFKVHLVGIENKDPNAIPVIIMHGWPGNFHELLPLVPFLLTAPNPPIHLIIPSLIGYGYSSSAPLDREFGQEGCARVFNSLMRGLGYDKYIAQGGDLGAYLGRIMAIRYEECQAVHFNFVPIVKPPSVLGAVTAPLTLTDTEKQGLERSSWFISQGHAYAEEHATKPATIGFALASSPVALLAWVGEKLLDWTDTTPSKDHILTWLSIYWLTKSFPTSIFYYRDFEARLSLTASPGSQAKDLSAKLEGMYVEKPIGFTKFPKELMVPPKSWVEATGNLVFYNEHKIGGHFAATEQPELLAKDFIDFLGLVWPAKGETKLSAAL